MRPDLNFCAAAIAVMIHSYTQKTPPASLVRRIRNRLNGVVAPRLFYSWM